MIFCTITLNLTLILQNMLTQDNLMKSYNIPLKRYSLGKPFDNHGYSLTRLYKNNNFVTVNVRFPYITSVNFTFRCVSTIDYFLCSFKDYSMIIKFQIEDLDDIYSDGLSVLKCDLQIQYEQIQNLTQYHQIRNIKNMHFHKKNSCLF